jgi:hypothetical protein
MGKWALICFGWDRVSDPVMRSEAPLLPTAAIYEALLAAISAPITSVYNL